MIKKLINLIPTLPLIQNTEDINESTRLEQDLRMNLYQARLFFIKYSDEFNVDISKLNTQNYFPKDSVWSIFYWKYLKPQKPSITIGNLLKAIPYKTINSSVIKDINSKGQEVPRKKIYLKTETHYKTEDIIISVLIFIALSIFLATVAILI